MCNLLRVIDPRAPEGNLHWEVLPSLTDQDGVLLDDNMDARAYHVLLEDKQLLDRLRGQQPKTVPEASVAQLHGNFGVLLRMAFPCAESDGDKFPARQEMHARLLPALAEAMRRQPGIEGVIPDASHIFKARVAAWVFIPDGLMNQQQIECIHAQVHRSAIQ